MSKIYKYITFILLILLAIVAVYFKILTNNLTKENNFLKNEKKEEVRRIRDSAFLRVDEITRLSNKKFDSILNIPPTIKWKKYEKLIYTNRSLDDALDVISDYKYDRGTKK